MGRTSRKRHQRKMINIKDIAESEDESLKHLKFWLTNHYPSNNHLQPFNFPNTGRGLKTLKDIEANDVLIKIPYQLLITTSTITQSGVRSLFSESEYYSAQCLLSVFIIYESHLGNISKWYHYINSLPQILTNPDFCTRKEKNLLPTFVIDYMYESHKVKNEYEFLIRSIHNLSLESKDSCFHCNVHFNKIITFEKYKWAYYIVNTRAVYIEPAHAERSKDITINVKPPNNLALAPFLDLFNHDIYSATHVVVTNENDCKFYQLVTVKSFQSGSQVFINYGAHNSLKLYVDYGFFIPNNPLDEIYFNISDIEACINIPKIKLNFIISNYLYKNMAFTREGLNYNAVCTLFVINTKLQRHCWNSKIYGNSFTSEDMANIHVTAKKILILKKNELIGNITNMKSIKDYTQCYSIAMSLVQEYIKILTASYNSCCTFG